jgi:hypothetical protein
MVARTVLASDTEGFCERACGGCDRCWTMSVAESTDASVERSAKMASGPRLTVVRRHLSIATDAFDAVGANAMISNGRTRGGRRSDGRYCAASVTLKNCPVRFLTALFDCGLINRSCGRPWLGAEHTIVFVACVVVLGSPLTHSCLIVFIGSSERTILVCCFERLHGVALGDRVTSRWCLLLLEVANS